ncbi:ShlB/FhaC/HecB family hemolysin secretion/activation protein [Chromobacterium haemolyticum]|uniref:ShlB/FhaC/HecB family hemolysin secretion/activation protein n=1 Tax=Chromobacterium haemolyticum TaxID=394935 RepID=A0ABS3GLG7_9NEIS|nr:ShlB/FhaC/HecB family hemolysin secretion/activation protein [Chromobacterium haemolyticum]MBK0414509.1 ShlB/FhaC/HecB family hemolysin secretion/activation protein [Chromobacterium haemolyticum]MBO0415857.1 ShlB/FhaC/HecB family hemolysin secretion/activation protein [Chromobacterium haemolyticum]MBO0499117.1 ShlB/FhaC/HecB family hemolysin secretion/activation protein [Chromobacterium haemolyticum]
MVARSLYACSFLLTLSLCSPNAIATSLSDQEFLRQKERTRSLRQEQEVAPDVRLQQGMSGSAMDPLPANESPCFRIQQIKLVGEQASAFSWLLTAAQAHDDALEGRCLGQRAISQLQDRMQNALIGRGYVTSRVLLAPQDISKGVLTFTFLPGRIQHIRFADGTSPRATLLNAMPAKEGDILNVRDIEQGLENFKRTPTTDADIQIMPATGPDAAPNQSDLQIQWKERFPYRLTLSVDDGGSQATGLYQGNVTVSADNVLTLNDLFYASHNQSLGGGQSGGRGSWSDTLHYSLPVGYWLLGMTFSHNEYRQSVAGAYQNYMYHGKSENNELLLSRVVYRDAVRKTSMTFKGWQRTANSYIDDAEIDVQKRRMAGWELGLSHREYRGAAFLDANLRYRQGTGALQSKSAPEEALSEGTSRMRLYLADTQLEVPFRLAGEFFHVNSSLRGQWNDTPLVPQDRFSIGSRYTVRGYNGENQLSAESGWLLRNDLGWFKAGMEFYLGYDYGRVSGPSAAWLQGQRLAGGTLGIRGQYLGVSYDLFVSQPFAYPENFRTPRTTGGFNLTTSF